MADGIGELTTESFAELISLETSGDLSATQAKTVLADLADKGGDPKEIAAHHGFEAMDTSELETLIEGILADHPEDWTAFVEGDPEERKKKSGFFVGQVMKMTKGQADGKVVNDILLHRAES